ncbi:MAG: LamG-like jellyroll fold domain-containing protein [Planctomycetota bacterium]
MQLSSLALLALALAPAAAAQTVEHYWDFSSMNDLVGGVPTVAVGTPDLSVHMTYGEAYPGAGASLNPVIGGTSNGSGYLEAAVFTGPATAMDYGTDSYSFSYWVWDDFAGDGDVNGPRVFDNLSGTAVGIQLATNTPGFWNLRNDSDSGDAHIFDQSQMFTPPQDRWVHIVGVVDRPLGQVRLYVDGALATSATLVNSPTGTAFTGNIFATQDLQIGAINGGAAPGQAQSMGLDDLAFYRGALSAADALALATRALSPLDFLRIGTRYCAPSVINASGAASVLIATGSAVAADNDVTLHATSMPLNSFGFFLTSRTQGMIAQPGGSQGVLCLGGNIGRYVGAGQIKNSGTTGAFSLVLNLTQHPTPSGLVAVLAGDTWNFQAWHRDIAAGVATSNFTDAVSVSFN